MSVQWSEIYSEVCGVLMEPGGFQLGIFTEGQFLTLAGEVLTEFLSLTGVVRKIFNLPALVGISTYSEPPQVGQVEAVNVGQSYCHRTSGYFLDNSDAEWGIFTGSPERWREDELTPETIQIIPAPQTIGNQVYISAGQGAYGTISSTSNPVDFNIQPDIGQTGYGTFSSFGGSPYVEAVNPGYGVISSIVPSTNNIQMIATALPDNVTEIQLTDYVELLPDSFTVYLKYGILARIFISDSELKDSQKGAYCAMRYREGILLAQTIMSQESAEAR